MTPLLVKFKAEFNEGLLDLLWRQWCAIGVPGYSRSAGSVVIDPEALILMTCSVGRADPRMFDEAVNWIAVHNNLVSTGRLKTLVKQYGFAGESVLGAMAAMLVDRVRTIKWRSLVGKKVGQRASREPEPLFFNREGRPLRSFGSPDPHFEQLGFLRGRIDLDQKARPYNPEEVACLSVRMRSLFGLGTRADIFAYLICNPGGAHASHMAREIGYNQKSVQEALVNMAHSQLVRVRSTGREKFYKIVPDLNAALTGGLKTAPVWVRLPAVFRFFEIVWTQLQDPTFNESTPVAQSAALRQLVKDAKKAYASAHFIDFLPEVEHQQGKDYAPVFMDGVRSLLKWIDTIANSKAS